MVFNGDVQNIGFACRHACAHTRIVCKLVNEQEKCAGTAHRENDKGRIDSAITFVVVGVERNHGPTAVKER